MFCPCNKAPWIRLTRARRLSPEAEPVFPTVGTEAAVVMLSSTNDGAA